MIHDLGGEKAVRSREAKMAVGENYYHDRRCAKPLLLQSGLTLIGFQARRLGEINERATPTHKLSECKQDREGSIFL